MRRLLMGTTVAALVLFFWGFLYWGASPLAWVIIGPVPDEVALQGALREALPEPGAYFLPHPGREDAETHSARAKAGPVATLLVHGGADPSDPTPFVAGFVHMWVSALLMGLLLRRFAPATFGSAVRVATLAGLAAAVWSNLGRPLWYWQPWDYHLLFAVYDFSGWVVAGTVLAYFVRPRPGRTVATD
jgi:hypothetical protein